MVTEESPPHGNLPQRDAAVRLLVECARHSEAFDPEHAAALLGQTTASEVLRAATYHALGGLGYVRLRNVAMPGELVDALRTKYEQAIHHHLGIMWALARVRSALDETGSPWAVVKGPMVAELLYDDPGERTYGDLDVLVEASGFDRALDGLRGHGARLLDRNWRVLRRDMRGEVHLELPSGSLLDLHWHLVNMYRGRICIDTAAMLSRVEKVDLKGVTAPTLDATDSLIHLALHGTLSGGDRLLWTSDVARGTWRRPPDWDELVFRAEAWKIGPPVGLMLRRAREVLNADIPSEVPEKLLGRSYGKLARVVEWASPWERAGGRLTTPALVLTRSMGFGLAGAGRWFIWRAIRNLDPREPRASSSFTPGGDASDYSAYVRAVVASSRPARPRPRA